MHTYFSPYNYLFFKKKQFNVYLMSSIASALIMIPAGICILLVGNDHPAEWETALRGQVRYYIQQPFCQ